MTVKQHGSLDEHLAYARRNRTSGTEYKPKPVRPEGDKKPKGKKEPVKDDNIQAD